MIKEMKPYDVQLSNEELAAAKGGQDPVPKVGDADDLGG